MFLKPKLPSFKNSGINIRKSAINVKSILHQLHILNANNNEFNCNKKLTYFAANIPDP
jgi:hypothetical protein